MHASETSFLSDLNTTATSALAGLLLTCSETSQNNLPPSFFQALKALLGFI